MSDPLLRIRNNHAAACGDPPLVNNEDPNLYIGYFENSFGEQWVFVFNRQTGEAHLRGGDAGWNTVHDASGGNSGDLILNPEESAWFGACWKAATRR